MKLPDWFCPIICAGLDLDELLEGKVPFPNPFLSNDPKPDTSGTAQKKLITSKRFKNIKPQFKQDESIDDNSSSNKEKYN